MKELNLFQPVKHDSSSGKRPSICSRRLGPRSQLFIQMNQTQNIHPDN